MVLQKLGLQMALSKNHFGHFWCWHLWVCALYTFEDLFEKWAENPLDSSVGVTSIDKINFPSITVCPKGKFDEFCFSSFGNSAL